MKLSDQKLENRARRVYERAIQKLDDIRITISEMVELIEDQTETSVKNPQAIHGTYLDKNKQRCPFDICNGDRGVTIATSKEVETMGVAIKCPCAAPESLREYQNKKKREIKT